jgi:hypothetical protein
MMVMVLGEAVVIDEAFSEGGERGGEGAGVGEGLREDREVEEDVGKEVWVKERRLNWKAARVQ